MSETFLRSSSSSSAAALKSASTGQEALAGLLAAARDSGLAASNGDMDRAGQVALAFRPAASLDAAATGQKYPQFASCFRRMSETPTTSTSQKSIAIPLTRKSKRSETI